MVGIMRVCMGLAVAVTVVLPSAGWAQAAKGKKEAAAGAVEIEEITVTAQKREENIQEIPDLGHGAHRRHAGAERGDETSSISARRAEPADRTRVTGSTIRARSITMRGVGPGRPELRRCKPTSGTLRRRRRTSPRSMAPTSTWRTSSASRCCADRKAPCTAATPSAARSTSSPRSRPRSARSPSRTEVGNYDTFKGRVTLNVPLIGKNGFFQSDALGDPQPAGNCGVQDARRLLYEHRAVAAPTSTI